MKLRFKTACCLATFASAAAALLATESLAQNVISTTPIVYYNFNEAPGSTTLTDGDLDGGSTYDATHQNSEITPQFSQGILRNAWDATGATGDAFETPALTDLAGFQDMSISVWVNADVHVVNDGIVATRGASGQDFFGLTQGSANGAEAIEFRTTGDGGGVTADGAAPLNAWTHIGATYGSFAGTREIFINGVSAFSSSTDPDYNWDSSVWQVGNDPTFNRFFDGQIDDLAIFNQSLTGTDFNTIYTQGIAGVAFDGLTNPLDGDVDGNGVVNDADLAPIVANLLDPGTRTDGDLNGDGVVGLADFRQWKTANSPGSSNAVPEPTSAALCGLIGLVGISMMRRRPTKALSVGIVVLGASLAVSDASAQVVATVDQETGQVTVLNEGEEAVTFEGYRFSSDNALLDDIGWTSFSGDLLSSSWRIVGSTSSSIFGEALVLGSGAVETLPMGSETPIDFGTAFNPGAIMQAQLDAGLGVDVRDLQFGYLGADATELTQATIRYIGETITNNLVLKVDTDTGNATLENESPFAVEIDAFAITSADSSLNGSWAGAPGLPLGGGPATGWQLGSPAADGLGQVNADGSVVIAASGGTLDFGDIFTPGSTEDLAFNFLRVGEDDGDGFGGVVEYISASLDGDYNDDGVVNAADYTVWRDNLGSSDAALNGNGSGDASGNVVQADYTLWAGNFGATSGSPASAVPEPTAACLAFLGLAAVGCRRK